MDCFLPVNCKNVQDPELLPTLSLTRQLLNCTEILGGPTGG